MSEESHTQWWPPPRAKNCPTDNFRVASSQFVSSSIYFIRSLAKSWKSYTLLSILCHYKYLGDDDAELLVCLLLLLFYYSSISLGSMRCDKKVLSNFSNRRRGFLLSILFYYELKSNCFDTQVCVCCKLNMGAFRIILLFSQWWE